MTVALDVMFFVPIVTVKVCDFFSPAGIAPMLAVFDETAEDSLMRTPVTSTVPTLRISYTTLTSCPLRAMPGVMVRLT